MCAQRYSQLCQEKDSTQRLLNVPVRFTLTRMWYVKRGCYWRGKEKPVEEDKQKMCPLVAGESLYFSCRKGNCALWDAETCRCAIASLPLELRELNKTITWATEHIVRGLNR